MQGENRQIAVLLREAAELLAAQGGNPFRAGAYRGAADTIERLEQPLRAVFEREGRAGLIALPHIGEGIASALAEILVTGRWAQLERLRGDDAAPERTFQAVPGIGPDLARRIHEYLHLDTLEALENACRDGSLVEVPGIGTRRAAAICAALTAMLDRKRALRRPLDRPRPANGPAIEMLLDVDHEYRDRAAAGRLPTIAPKRFNPAGDAWLPVLHTRRSDWHFTALFSNTARAHELGRTRDWVVIYFYDDAHIEGQHTVVTETRGTLASERVVRGRETECRAFYAARGDAQTPAAQPGRASRVKSARSTSRPARSR
ncbi:MAG: helix-hairpin-helix domain-containing protein [Burkholderiales bacterium]